METASSSRGEDETEVIRYVRSNCESGRRASAETCGSSIADLISAHCAVNDPVLLDNDEVVAGRILEVGVGCRDRLCLVLVCVRRHLSWQ